jgi:urea transport system permease protein
VNGAKSFLTASLSDYWLYFLGGMFVVVPLWLPNGVVGVFKRRRGKK